MKRSVVTLLTASLVSASLLALSSISGAAALSGKIAIDGSSTVFPITEAVAEEFMGDNPGVQVIVGVSGTGGGFKRFCVGETDISDASRPIKQKEIEIASQNGIQFIELPVAYDGIAVVVNPKATWVDYLSVEELKAIWNKDSQIKNWKQVRQGFPDKPLKLYGPGTDSGTFEYFTEAVNGEARSCRSDFTGSEDDNVLVQGVAGDPGALGYFGLAYYEENMDKLKIVPVKYNGKTVTPSHATVVNGTYQPLSRPLFIYVSSKAVKRGEVSAFANYYLDNAADLAAEVGYVELPAELYAQGRKHLQNGVYGTMFGGEGATVGVSLTELMSKLASK